MKLKNINRILISGLLGVLANSSGAQADSIIMDNLSNGDYGYVGAWQVG